jgi:hypothetical protein
MVSRISRRSVPWLVVSFVGIVVATPPARAVVRDVGLGQPYATIAAALAASSDGDVINIVDPVHTEADINVSVAVTIQGQGAPATVVQAHPGFGLASARVFTVSSPARVVIRDVTIRHGNEPTNANGGGIFLSDGCLLLDRVVITLNRDGAEPGGHSRGGGIYVSMGALRVRDSTISDNVAEGGVTGVNGWGGYASGGGVYVSSNDVAEIVNTTISGNQALGGDGVIDGYSFGWGGGISQAWGTLNLINSVVRGNHAIGGAVTNGFGGPAEGGGIFGGSNGAVHLVNTTVSSNLAQGGSGTTGSQVLGGGLKLRNGSLTSSTVADNQTLGGTTMYAGGLYSEGFPGEGPVIKNSVLADNICTADPSAADLKGHVVSGDYNIVENSGATFSGVTIHNMIGTNPLLVPLGDWGGPTWTHPLAVGSPAIDMVPSGVNGCLPGGFDQRGYYRAAGTLAGGSACDCGAFESGSSDAGVVFFDAFESGSTCMWSRTAP